MYITKGKLFLNKIALSSAPNNKFTYVDVLNHLVSYKLEHKSAERDEVKLRISDGSFSVSSSLHIEKFSAQKETPVLLRNEGLQAIAGKKYSM